MRTASILIACTAAVALFAASPSPAQSPPAQPDAKAAAQPPAQAQKMQTALPAPGGPAAPAKVQTLRGDTPIDKTVEPDVFKMERDQPPIPRDFVQQPPLIPHTIRGYQITTNFNKCMDCHAWSKVKETGATKVSVTHFKDSTGRELANISPRRYVCTTCHVPQADAKPLVVNTYRPLAEIAPAK